MFSVSRSLTLSSAAAYASFVIFCARVRRLRSRRNKSTRPKRISTATGTPTPVPTARLLRDDCAGSDEPSTGEDGGRIADSERLGDDWEATELGVIAVDEDEEGNKRSVGPAILTGPIAGLKTSPLQHPVPFSVLQQ